MVFTRFRRPSTGAGGDGRPYARRSHVPTTVFCTEDWYRKFIMVIRCVPPHRFPGTVIFVWHRPRRDTGGTHNGSAARGGGNFWDKKKNSKRGMNVKCFFFPPPFPFSSPPAAYTPARGSRATRQTPFRDHPSWHGRAHDGCSDVHESICRAPLSKLRAAVSRVSSAIGVTRGLKKERREQKKKKKEKKHLGGPDTVIISVIKNGSGLNANTTLAYNICVFNFNFSLYVRFFFFFVRPY